MVRGVQILVVLLGAVGLVLLSVWGAALLFGGGTVVADVRVVGVGLFLAITASFMAALAVVAVRARN